MTYIQFRLIFWAYFSADQTHLFELAKPSFSNISAVEQFLAETLEKLKKNVSFSWQIIRLSAFFLEPLG